MTNEEIIKKIKNAENPEELLKIAKENGMEDFTEESAKAYFDILNKSGEVSDQELDQAVGGCKRGGKRVVSAGYICPDRTGFTWECKVCHKDFVNCTCNRSGLHPTKNTEWTGPWGNITFKLSSCGICGTCAHCSYEKGLWVCNSETANAK